MRVLSIVFCFALLWVGEGSAQTARRIPRVRTLTLEGVTALPESAVRDSLVTRASGCRGLLLRPLCAVTHVSFFYEKNELEAEEVPRDALRIRVIYFRNGYRETQVASAIEPVGTDGEYVDVVFRVSEGPLTTVGSLEVTQSREVLSAGRIRAADLPATGDALDLNRIDSARIRLRNALWDRGYADAVVSDSVVVDPATHVAALAIAIETGPATTIGSVAVEGNETVSDRTVTRLLDLPVGSAFRRTDLTAGQRRLFDTQLFRQSVVRVPATPDSLKRVVVSVREAPSRSLSVGAGFNTVDFAQSEVRFVRYNLFGGARRLDARAAVGNLLVRQLSGRGVFRDVTTAPLGGEVDGSFLRPTWQLGLELTQPFFLSRSMSLGVGVSASRRTIPGVVIDRGLAANVAVTRRIGEGFPVSLAYRFERADIEAGDLYFCINFGVCDVPTVHALDQPHRLSPITLTARLERADDPIAPTTGYLARVDLVHASRLTASDFQFQRVDGEASRYLRLGRFVLAGRVRAGWVRPLGGTRGALGLPEGDTGILHPRLRFLAGGSRSVRGFAENQLGPRVLTIAPSVLLSADSTGAPVCSTAAIADASCDPNAVPSSEFAARPLGGNTLLEAGVELRVPLLRGITGAVFVDAGSLRGQRLNFPPGSRSAVTPGFGFRYRSPIGPVRIDLGIRNLAVEDLPVVTQLPGPDGEPRLVQLATMKRYDPLEGRTARFLSVFSRLQLHLAIGEAY